MSIPILAQLAVLCSPGGESEWKQVCLLIPVLRVVGYLLNSLTTIMVCHKCELSFKACVTFCAKHSDPYTRISLYDPVNGELTSVQTKTIKKVSDYLLTEMFQ